MLDLYTFVFKQQKQLTSLTKCLQSKHGIVVLLSRTFRRLDENGDKRIDFVEFESTLNDHGVDADSATKRQCFEEMDLDGSGAINFDEFLIAMRVRVLTANYIIDLAYRETTFCELIYAYNPTK